MFKRLFSSYHLGKFPLKPELQSHYFQISDFDEQDLIKFGVNALQNLNSYSSLIYLFIVNK